MRNTTDCAIFIQGVPQLSSYFVLVVFAASCAFTEDSFTICQYELDHFFT